MALTLGISEIKVVVENLTDKLGFDYSNYSLAFLKRRLTYVFNELNIKKLDAFFESLSDLQFVEKFNYFFAVPETELFRDPTFWRVLRSKCIVESDCERIVWFPDASSGEEIFSFLIMLHDIDMIDQIELHCNHNSEKKLDEIKRGILCDRNLEVNESNLKRFGAKGSLLDYFDSTEEGIQLKPELIKNIRVHNNHFSQQVFIKKPGIIIFRNSMLYFTRKYWAESSAIIYNSLCLKGILAIGIKESLPESVLNNMLSYDNSEQIYLRHPASVPTL